MTKMLKATLKMSDGSERIMRTYANEDYVTPEQAFEGWIRNGAEIVSYEWIDTLTKEREEWNKEHPDIPIPLDM